MKTRFLILIAIGVAIVAAIALFSSFSIQKDSESYVLFCNHWIFSSSKTCTPLWNESQEPQIIDSEIVVIPSPEEFLKMDCEDLNHMYPDFPSEPIADAWITRMHECMNQQDQLHVLIELDKWRKASCDSILNDGIPTFQNKVSQQAYDVRWIQCVEIENSKDMLHFDTSLYYEEFGPGSPLIYLDSHTPVLHEANCDRYSYWMTEHQKEKPEFSENYSRYPPWGNQIFPLVEYCLDVGSLIKSDSGENFKWRFELNEN